MIKVSILATAESLSKDNFLEHAIEVKSMAKLRDQTLSRLKRLNLVLNSDNEKRLYTATAK